jgi:hypothetical protein
MWLLGVVLVVVLWRLYRLWGVPRWVLIGLASLALWWRGRR